MPALLIGSAGDAPFTLPLDALTTMTLIIGRRGSGKTTTAMILTEEFVANGLPVVLLDPLGVHYGLRSNAAGDGPGLPVTILGGPHGDLAINETAGKLIADLVVDQPGAYIIDFSGFESRSAEKRFAAAFADRLYQRKAHDRSALGLIIDEADTFAPQLAEADDRRMLGAFAAIARRGRVRGLGMVAITQRPAVLNKNISTQTELMIVHQLTSPQDRLALRAWAEGYADKAELEAFMASLASLEVGEAWIWSPSWLGVFQRVRIRQRWTFDSSATPKTGEVRVEPRVLAPVDIEKLQALMAETIEKAEADDPVKLRERIRALEGMIDVVKVSARDQSWEDEVASLMQRITVAERERDDAQGDLVRARQDVQEARGNAERIAGALGEERDAIDAVVAARRQIHEIVLNLPSDGQVEPGTPLRATVARLAGDTSSTVTGAQVRPADERGSTPAAVDDNGARQPTETGRDTEDMRDEEVVELINHAVAEAVAKLPGSRTLYVPPAEVIRKSYLTKAIDRLMADLKALGPDALEVYRLLLSRETYMSIGQIQQVIVGYQGGSTMTKWGGAAKALVDAGLAVKPSNGAANYKADDKEARTRVRKALEPHLATDQEVDQVYQAVLGRIAGEAVA